MTPGILLRCPDVKDNTGIPVRSFKNFPGIVQDQVRDKAQIDSCYPPGNGDDTGNLNPVPPVYLNPGLI
jgi:hypothetical protein